MNYNIVCACLKGKRKNNDDRIFVNSLSHCDGIYSYLIHGNCLCGVCDGISGMAGGAAAAERVSAAFAALYPEIEHESAITASLRLLNEELCKMGEEYPQGSIGTTIAGFFLRDDEEPFAFSCGDSRLYTWHNERGLEQISIDDSVGQRLREQGIEPPPFYENLLYSSVGSKSYSLRSYKPDRAEMYIICSDGISSFVSVEEIGEILGKSSTVDEKLEELIKKAALSSDDNMSLIMIEPKEEN